jgi:hypothetical protein
VEEKYRLMKRLNFQIMKLNMMRRASPLLEENQVYCEKVLERLSQKDSKKGGGGKKESKASSAFSTSE